MDFKLEMKSVLVTGASGLIGRQVSKDLVEKNINVFSCCHETKPDFGNPISLDLSDENKIKEIVHEINPDVIIHLGAITDVEKCERHLEIINHVNVRSTEILAKEADRKDSFFVYISTDYVFDGKKGMKNENDTINPLNNYGRSKLEGEKSLMRNSSRFSIIRTSTPFGIHPIKKSFPVWVIENLKSKNRIPVLIDQFTSPTFVPNLSKMIIEVAERQISGTLHLAGASRISRFDFAKMVAERLGLDRTLLKECRIQDMKWNAERPVDSSLDVSKAIKILDNKPQKIEQSLELFVKQIKETNPN